MSSIFGEKIVKTIARTATTDMEVTSIRLEKALKERLKEFSGNQGYQALIRDILWNYVQQKSGDYRPRFCRADIRATFDATAKKDEICTLTGRLIPSDTKMLLGLTVHGDIVPLSPDSFKD